MRLTFEKADIVRMLSQTLGYEVTDDDVVIQTDPFEVQVSNVDVDKLAQPSAPPVDLEEFNKLLTQHAPEPPETKPTVRPSEDDDIFTMADLLAQNSSLASRGPRRADTEDDTMTRPLGPQESLEPPPITEEEMFSTKEGT